MSDDQTPPPSDQPPADPTTSSTPVAPVKAAKAPVKKAPAKRTAKAPAKTPAKATKAPAKRAPAKAPVLPAAEPTLFDPAPAEATPAVPPAVEPTRATSPPADATPADLTAPASSGVDSSVVERSRSDRRDQAEPAEPADPTVETPPPVSPSAVPAMRPAPAAPVDTADDLPAPMAAVPPADPPAAHPHPARDDDPDEERKGLPLWQESLLLVGVALVLAIVIKAFFVQAFYIPSESMEPGLVDNDRILVEKPSYWAGGTPQRGDVIVFKDPDHWLVGDEDAGPKNFVAKALAKVGLFPSGGHLVKRVIGVAGDTITCCDATTGEISVNGHPLDETKYVLQEKNLPCYGPQTGDCSWTAGPVPKGELFVMGDNRAHSGDSSAHLCTSDETDCTDNPYVKVSLVTGKVFNLVWPLSHFTFLHRPSDFDSIPDPQ